MEIKMNNLYDWYYNDMFNKTSYLTSTFGEDEESALESLKKQVHLLGLDVNGVTVRTLNDLSGRIYPVMRKSQYVS